MMLLPHWPTPAEWEQWDVPWLHSDTFIITKNNGSSEKHGPQRQTEGERGLDQASQDMLMSLMTLPWVAYGRLGAVKAALLEGLQISLKPDKHMIVS